jgi:microcystin-dependent protein
MADAPFLGEIKIVPWGVVPQGWAHCDGQLLLIAQNQALFALLGTQHGGDGVTNFALPDMRGRMPVHPKTGYPFGQPGGSETHTLTALEMQTHSHAVFAATAAGLGASTDNVWGVSGLTPYHPIADSAMTPLGVLDAAGGGQPHPNIQPYVTLAFIIALQGEIPTSEGPSLAIAFVAEIRIVAFNFAPSGWAKCEGQLMNLSTNTALFSLIGTFYGGDGRTTFALPDFRATAPILYGEGPGLTPHEWSGEFGGEEYVSLTAAQTPSHNHQLRSVSSAAAQTSPVGNAWASSGTRPYSAQGSLTTMAESAIATAGGGQAHYNVQPYLPLLFLICVQGIFPPRK